MKVYEHITVNNISLYKFQIRNTTVVIESPMTTATTKITTKPKQSLVWTYFRRINTAETLQAQCLIRGCHKVLLAPLYSATTLIRYLRATHKLPEFKPKAKLVNYSNKKKFLLI